MLFSSISAALFSLLAVRQATAATFQVMVSNENQEFKFTPETVEGVVADDIVQFLFLAGNHTVTQSTFDAPCTASADGLDSGFQPPDAASGSVPSWSFTVEDSTTASWFYCKQGPHCQRGMVFSVNPTAEKTHEAFKAAAMSGETAASPTVSADGAEATTENAASMNGRSVVAVLLAGFGLVAGLL